MSNASLSPITALLHQELEAVNGLIISSLASSVPQVEQIGHYLIEGGGKRVRPIVTLLSAAAYGFHEPSVITMATIIEFIHSATLLHDDVVDESALRRGRATVNAVWDNASAVLVGDFLYSRAFQMMVGLGSMTAMRILADATNAIAEGEVLQLTHRFEPEISQERYFRVIALKTATLFEAAGALGGVLAGQAEEDWQALGRYGKHLGIAFQLIDDLLDYQAEEGLGKHLGDDLAEGKMTLPLIYTLQQANGKEASYLKEVIRTGSIDDLSGVQESIVSSGAIDYTMRAAKREKEEAIRAIQGLPDSTYRDALVTLAEFAVYRNM